jgi:hypothetical protein
MSDIVDYASNVNRPIKLFLNKKISTPRLKRREAPIDGISAFNITLFSQNR